MSTLPGFVEVPQEPSMLVESIWRAPLVPAALSFTVGVIVDRSLALPFLFCLLLGGSALVAFVLMRLARNDRQPPVYLLIAGVALGAGHHHVHQRLFAPDDVGRYLSDQPQIVRLQGILAEEPRRLPAGPPDPLRSQPRPATAACLLRATRLNQQAVSGKVRLVVSGVPPLLANLHTGDAIEVRGQLVRPFQQANPGEFDASAHWRQRGVRAMMIVQPGERAVRLVSSGWTGSPGGWIGVVREFAHLKLDAAIHDRSRAALARALLLGEGAPMSNDDWSRYVRTGVVHVLAISGQHLVVVALFLWGITRLFGIRQRRAAILVGVTLLGYALLTGGRPPALRSAVGACLVCGGLVLRRAIVPANLFALGWLVVGLWNPADLFEQGCQLSFLSVAILCWGVSWITARRKDPLDALVEESYPAWLRGLRGLGRIILRSYLICFVVWIAITPLVAFHTGLVAPSALLLGPPLTLLTSIALLQGFLVLLLPGALGWLPARVVEWSLGGCEWLVGLAERWPTHVWVGSLPAWWVATLYLVLLVVITHHVLRLRWRWFAPAGLAWLCLGLLLGVEVRRSPEMQLTFLAVGHGGAIVIELPDGRTILYDVGSLRGPDVADRVIAPFLWSRKVQRLDEVILSHPDLDHFNALIALSERFAIGRILTTDTFDERPSLAVSLTRQRLGHLRWETIAAGDRLRGSNVTLEVLHPPRRFRQGNENARSLVIEIRHQDNVVLLTGDLEGDGLTRLLQSRPRKVDVLQAPHHGSSRLDVTGLLRWCQPDLVVSCQGIPQNNKAAATYGRFGVSYWTTHERGAVLLRSRGGELEVEARHDGRRWRKQ